MEWQWWPVDTKCKSPLQSISTEINHKTFLQSKSPGIDCKPTLTSNAHCQVHNRQQPCTIQGFTWRLNWCTWIGRGLTGLSSFGADYVLVNPDSRECGISRDLHTQDVSLAVPSWGVGTSWYVQPSQYFSWAFNPSSPGICVRHPWQNATYSTPMIESKCWQYVPICYKWGE